MINDLIAVSLPFALLIAIKLLNPKIRVYVERMATIYGKNVNISHNVEQFGIDLTVQTYLHLSFIFNLLTSSISCIAFTILCARPMLAAVGATAIVLLLPWWIIRWQGLSATELQGPEGRPMRISAWGVIFLLWGVTLYAKFSP
jgi:hypothetical protein